MIGGLLDQILSSRPARYAANAGFSWIGRRRTAQLDRLPIAEAQETTLLRHVRHASQTRFGREHDFAGIRAVQDYKKRVPLRDYEAFWKEYWQPHFPSVQHSTWPDPVPYFALSSGTTAGTTKYIPVTRRILRSNQRAAMTALAWHQMANPRARLFSGQLLFLGGSTSLQPAEPRGSSKQEIKNPRSLMGDLSGIVAAEAPRLLRPFAFPPLDLALLTDWETKLELLARKSIELPITTLTGVPSWLLALFDRVRRLTGRERLIDIWPTLQLIVHGGTSFQPYRQLFREVAGSNQVQFLETYPASESFVAAEDPRYQLLRLIPDHDVFYEFVPVTELASSEPVRHTVGEIVPGVQYAVVLTTSAGLWSYLLGDTVCFESRSPPLLRFTGRTRQFLSTFGEHLICEEVERAIAYAAGETNAAIADFHVGPQFPDEPGAPGRHCYFIEFVSTPASLARFGWALDASLRQQNADYDAHRQGDLTLSEPEIEVIPRGGFARWMRSRGKLGGQHKVPRLDSTGELTRAVKSWLAAETAHDMSTSR